MSVELEKEGIERFFSNIKANLDPTANPPEFAFTTGTDRPSSWVDGAWDGAASGSGTTWSARALTPLIGFTGSGADIELEAGSPVPWVRITVADEVIVRKLAKIKIKG